jgi:hypothetical protein
MSTICTHMKITIRQLRKLISEEVDRCVRNSAGLFGGGMGHNSVGTPGPAPDEMNPDPRNDKEKDDEEEQKISSRRKRA